MFPRLFAWLLETDFEGRVREINRYYAQKFISRSPIKNSRSYIAALQIIHKPEQSITNDDEYSLTQKTNKFTKYKRFVMWMYHRNADNELWIVCINILFWGFLWVPAATLSAWYTLLYPILCFVITPWQEQLLVHQVLSISTLGVYAVLLVLSRPVYKFHDRVSQLHQPCFTDAYDFDHIKATYENRRLWQVAANTGRVAVMVASARVDVSQPRTTESMLHLLPEICHFAGFPKSGVLDVAKFVVTDSFFQLTHDRVKNELSVVVERAAETNEEDERYLIPPINEDSPLNDPSEC